jgi:hypothetical protein
MKNYSQNAWNLGQESNPGYPEYQEAVVSFKTKLSYVTNDTSKPCIKNHLYHNSTPCEVVICDSAGMTGDHILYQ